MAENHLRQAFESGEFICTAEFVLGRDYTLAEAEQFVRDAAADPQGVKVISLTDLPGGNPAVPPEAFAAYVLEHALTPLVHLTAKDCNRALLEGRLHALARMGADNVLVLSGDAPASGFKGQPKPVYDLDSVQLVRLICALKDGMAYRVGTRELHTRPHDFQIGSVVNPFKIVEAALMTQMYKLELKIRCGTQFIITQVGYNVRKLQELRHYMQARGLGHVPVLANVYVPTATIARLMQAGDVPGCVIPDRLIEALRRENKSQRFERAAVQVAAAKGLGYAGAHIGGFGLRHQDMVFIRERAEDIGEGWRDRLDDLLFAYGDHDWYLYPPAGNGLSDVSQPPAAPAVRPPASFCSRLFKLIHHTVVAEFSPVGHYFTWRMKRLRAKYQDAWQRGLTFHLLDCADVVKGPLLGCVKCGDCMQDYLGFCGCSMGRCVKETRNGPCGGSRVDGTCEVDAGRLCVWNAAYRDLRASGRPPEHFAATLLPPRRWDLNRTNSLANYFAGVDSNPQRRTVPLHPADRSGAPTPRLRASGFHATT